MDLLASQPYNDSIEMSENRGKLTSHAIVIKKAVKRYGNTTVLEKLNMTVPRSCIYALLGASGCGKTTLLSCIVGVRELDHGDIWVLGGKPGDGNSGIPGPRVGYMPQDISLSQEFTTSEAIYYFGRINGIKDDVIGNKYDFYEDLLCLPRKKCFVKDMSGGQQRRVSLTASLIHEPELLILDEPTVGLDPMLRENIWNYLVKISEENGTAVVITTHYIDEAKLANKIGLMRNGQLLAETSPANLMSKFQCSTLEEAFFTLSEEQDDNDKVKIIEIDDDIDELQNHQEDISTNSSKTRKLVTKEIFRALMIKNFLQFIRHPGTLATSIFVPFIAIAFFFNTIGKDPTGAVVAIVNDEAGDCNSGRYHGKVIYDPASDICEYVNISCAFLNNFNETFVIKQYFDSLEEATLAIKSGRARGLLHFTSNYSHALRNRHEYIMILSEVEINDSEIQVSLDMSDMIGLYLQRKIYEQFLKTQAEILDECDISKRFADTPIHFEEPIFGAMDQQFTNFIAPAYILSLTAFVAATVSSTIIIADRAEGVWDRSLVHGVTNSTILCSHILMQSILVLIQVAIFLSIFLCYYDLTFKVNLMLIVAFLLLSGLLGLCYGFLLSVYCNNFMMTNSILIGSLYLIILLCGVLWPIEGMPISLRWVSYFIPLTIPNQSFRNVLVKAYSIDNPEVYNGFLILSGWSIILFVCCLLGLRRKST